MVSLQTVNLFGEMEQLDGVIEVGGSYCQPSQSHKEVDHALRFVEGSWVERVLAASPEPYIA